MMMSMVAPNSNVPGMTTFGNKVIVMKLRPVPLLRTSSIASGRMPPLVAIVIASDVATRATANRMLLVSFMIWAAPGFSPATTTVGPHRRKSGVSSATFAGSPETMTASVPAFAPTTPPLIGASITVTPWDAQACSTSAIKGPPTVQVLIKVLSALPASNPSGPLSVWRNTSSVGTETTIVSQASASAFGEAARRACRSRSGRIASSRTSQTHSSCPPSRSLPAMGWPMLPTPRNPMRMSNLSCLSAGKLNSSEAPLRTPIGHETAPAGVAVVADLRRRAAPAELDATLRLVAQEHHEIGSLARLRARRLVRHDQGRTRARAGDAIQHVLRNRDPVERGLGTVSTFQCDHAPSYGCVAARTIHGGEDKRADRTIRVRDRDRTFEGGLEGLPDIEFLRLAADQHRYRRELARGLSRRLGSSSSCRVGGVGRSARCSNGIGLRLQVGPGSGQLRLKIGDAGGRACLGVFGLLLCLGRGCGCKRRFG